MLKVLLKSGEDVRLPYTAYFRLGESNYQYGSVPAAVHTPLL